MRCNRKAKSQRVPGYATEARKIKVSVDPYGSTDVIPTNNFKLRFVTPPKQVSPAQRRLTGQAEVRPGLLPAVPARLQEEQLPEQALA